MVLLTGDQHKWGGGSRDNVKHGSRMLHVRNSVFCSKNVKMLPSPSFCQDFAHPGVDISRFYSVLCNMKQRQEPSSPTVSPGPCSALNEGTSAQRGVKPPQKP